MKKLLIIYCLFAACFSLHARAIYDEAALSEEKLKTGYAFGVIIGSQLSDAGIEMDERAFINGFAAAMKNESLKISYEDAMGIAEAAFSAVEARKNDEFRVKELLFLAENGARPEVITTESGLQYEPLTVTDGAKPSRNDVVSVYYEGKLADGKIFDSRSSSEKPVEFPLDAVIPGWSEGLQLMSAGSIYRLYIPSNLAYGAMGAGQVIPPYSTLIFTVELLEIIKSPDKDNPAEND